MPPGTRTLPSSNNGRKAALPPRLRASRWRKPTCALPGKPADTDIPTPLHRRAGRCFGTVCNRRARRWSNPPRWRKIRPTGIWKCRASPSTNNGTVPHSPRPPRAPAPPPPPGPSLPTPLVYYFFAISESNYLLPKWYGKPGDSERYAAQVADRIGGEEGNAVYFQIAAAINCCKRTQAPALSWPRVQQGFAAIESLYGSTNHERNVMAFLALRSGADAPAQKLFARIGNDWSESVWKSKAAFDAARTGKAAGNSL